MTTFETENAEWIALHAHEPVRVDMLHSATNEWAAMRTTFASKASRMYFTKAAYRAGQGLTRSTGGHDFIDTRQPARSGLLHQPGMPEPERTVLRHLSNFVRSLRVPVKLEETKAPVLDVTFGVSAP